MKKIIFLVDGWGPTFGGINSFNYDFILALGKLNCVRITCCCVDACTADIIEADENNIKLINITKQDFYENKFNCLADEISDTKETIYWVGHDVITGNQALFCKKKFNKGKVVIFNHMDYSETLNIRHGPTIALKRSEMQFKIFEEADHVFSVGPKLYKATYDNFLQTSSIKKLHQILPGLCKIDPVEEIANYFSVVHFGRIEKNNDKIKQSDLVVRSYSNFAKNINSYLPKLYLFGLSEKTDEGKKEQIDHVIKLSEEENIDYKNIYPLSYTNNRQELFNVLKQSSVSMMLSLSEGFGLAGLESIAAGVPLIISENSGLYQFLKEQCLDLFVYKIPVKSTYTQANNLEDVQNATIALQAIYDNYCSYKKIALILKKELEKVLTWENSARSFLSFLNIRSTMLSLCKKEVTTNIKINTPKIAAKEKIDLVDKLQRSGFTLSNTGHANKFIGQFETSAFYGFLLKESVLRLWIWGRKNTKLFKNNENRWFFKDLNRRKECGLDFRCLFLNPESPAEVLNKAQQSSTFKSNLINSIENAKAILCENGIEFNSVCKYYNIIRDSEVIIVIDDCVIFTPIFLDNDGYPQHLTDLEFFVVSAESTLGKKLIDKFIKIWQG